MHMSVSGPVEAGQGTREGEARPRMLRPSRRLGSESAEGKGNPEHTWNLVMEAKLETRHKTPRRDADYTSVLTHFLRVMPSGLYK